jgi:hypothetical protein
VGAEPRGGTGGAPALPDSGDRQTRWAVGGYIAALIFLQKLAIGFGDKQVSILVPATYLLMGLLVWRRQLMASPSRLLLFAAFVVTAAASQALVPRPISLPSFLALPILYFPLAFSLDLDAEGWRDLLDLFQRLMLVIAGVVSFQFLTLWAFHWQPNLEAVLPQELLLRGYAYDIVRWGAGRVRPNGLFFLEPSFASIFLAAALIIELLLFRRLLLLLAFAAGLAASQGGSGLVMPVVALPLLLGRAGPRAALLLVLIGLLLAGVIAAFGAGAPFLARLAEFSLPESSGYLRVIEPFLQLGDAFNRAGAPWDAVGAGNAPIGDANAWPITKLAYEYGFLVALLLPALVAVACVSGPLLPLLLALQVIYDVTGGYLHSPVLVPLMFVLGALLRPPQADGTVLGARRHA